MKDFLFTERLQRGLCAAVRQDTIPRFIRENERVLRKIDKKLKTVQIPDNRNQNRSAKPFDKVCKFICDNFLDLLNELSTPYTLKLQQGTAQHEFHRHLMSAKHTKDWEKFYDEHEIVFDTVIQWARNQDVMRIEIEGNGGKRYRSLKDARNDESANRAEFPLLKFPEDNSYDDRRRSLESEVPRNPGKIEYNGYRRPSPEKQQSRQLGRLRSIQDSSDHTADWLNRHHTSNFQQPRSPFHIEIPQRNPHPNPQRERTQINVSPVETGQTLALESERRLRFFQQCGLMKLSWSEQQNEWDAWLKSMRDAVLAAKMYFVNFGYKNFDTVRMQYEEIQFRWETVRFTEHIENAYNKLFHDFKVLAVLSRSYEEKLFLKVVQKIVSEVADRLCALLEELRDFKFTEEYLHLIQNLEDDINPRDFPTAVTLRQICKEEKLEDYKDIAPPKQPRRS